MTTHHILFELGCEELPPKNLKTLRDALHHELSTRLNTAGIPFDTMHAYAAPRRLALHIEGIASAQPDRLVEKKGPALAAAYKEDGSPSPALLGFAKSAGVAIDALERIMTDKGEWLVHRQTISGQSIDTLLPQLIQESLDALPIAKRMRSGASRTEFVRPVQWVVLMKDAQVIPATIQDFAASNCTYGHRFHAPQALTLAHARDYLSTLEQAYVLADFDQRRTRILEQVQTLSQQVNGIAITPEDLTDEVTALVEWPVALLAHFEERFLSVPQEALISTMQDNQKYFCLVNHQQKLLPHFITISNIESLDAQQIIVGNEKVVRPRLSDAEFFFKQDQKAPLASRAEKLKQMVFHPQLGSLWDKSERIAAMAHWMANTLGDNADEAHQAALLAKCDLASDMVGEFPEMQGIAGCYYAAAEGLPASLAESLREQYLPRFAGDQLPTTRTGIALALADRLDTLVGIFGINQPPTGNKDPYSLRRAAIGVLRILTEKQLTLALNTLIQHMLSIYGGLIQHPEKTHQAVLDFFEGRYRALFEDKGIAVDVIQAVQAVKPSSPFDFERRIQAVAEFKQRPEAASLAAANKRVANILAKENGNKASEQTHIRSELLHESAEHALFNTLTALQPNVMQHIESGEYGVALATLATLRPTVDDFFENVMVMAEDPSVKTNRLALLTQLRSMFTAIADISLLQS